MGRSFFFLPAMRNPRKTSLRCWPFWLLVLAWVCANGPQLIVHEAVVWVKGAQTFSHQARLVAEVEQAMKTQREPAMLAAATPKNGAHHEAPAMPVETAVKKLTLSSQSAPRAPRPSAEAQGFLMSFDWSTPAALAVEAPYQPPRDGLLA